MNMARKSQSLLPAHNILGKALKPCPFVFLRQQSMKNPKLYPGIIKKRYKRFLSDIILDSGEEIVAHVANTGSMKTCWGEDWPVLLSKSDNPKRKLQYSLELTNNGNTWIGINTHKTNKLAIEAIENGTITELQGHKSLRAEYKIGDSRIDILLEDEDDSKHFVEVKNVTLLGDNNIATFPDSETKRGQKHLIELTSLVKEGHKASMLYIVQRGDVELFMPAKEIDPKYAELLSDAHKAGVNILVYKCKLTEDEISVYSQMPFKL